MLDESGVPRHSSDTKVEKFDDETVVYCQRPKKAIYLNETASIIWSLCDGHRTVASIADLISQNYPEQTEEVRAHVLEAIKSLWQEGAIRIKSVGEN